MCHNIIVYAICVTCNLKMCKDNEAQTETAIRNIIDNFNTISNSIKAITKRVRNRELQTEHGLSYLEMKSNLMTEYLMDLTLLVSKKVTTGTIQNNCNDILNRLIENKVVLEKTRVIDKRLKYYIDRLIKTANNSGVANNTNLHQLKANPDNFLDVDNVADNKSSVQNQSVYVPPKISAVYYPEDKAIMEQQRSDDKQRLNLSAAIRQDLIEEYLDEPLEISHSNRLKQVLSKKEKERIEFEESNLTRLTETKADKARKRKLMTIGTLADDLLMDSVGYKPKKTKKFK